MKQNMPIKRNCACVYTVDMQRKASEGTINLGDSLMLMITCFFYHRKGGIRSAEFPWLALQHPPPPHSVLGVVLETFGSLVRC